MEVRQTATQGGALEPINELSETFGWLISHWYLIVILIGLIVAIAVIVFLYKSRENERLERDSEGYKHRNNLMENCKMNADKTKIKNTYSWMNLFWFGIPFKRNEHSAKLLDYEGKLIGYYRGHSFGQNNMVTYLLYKKKSLFFFENQFLLQFPKKMTLTYMEDNKKRKLNLIW